MAVFTVVLFAAGDTGQILAALSTPSWLLFAVIGILGVGFSFILYIIGLNYTAPTVAMIEPVTASLFGSMKAWWRSSLPAWSLSWRR